MSYPSSAYSVESLELRTLLAVNPAALPDFTGISTPLVTLYRRGITAANRASQLKPGGMLFDAKNRVGVRITARNVTKLLPLLAKSGFVRTSLRANRHYVEGYLPSTAIAQMGKLRSSGLLGMIPMHRPMTAVGKATSQSDALMSVDRARLASGVDGTGVTVGVLSDSYDNLHGAAAGVASGDLTANVNVLQDDPSGGTDEGRAMLEIVHDLAPGANLAFATAYISEAGFADNIVKLAKPVAQGGAGANVIVDDVTYLEEPFFQDGIVAQAVETAVNTYGAAYFAAANNNDTQSYESANVNFVTDIIPSISPLPGAYYNFNPTGTTDKQSFTLGQTQELLLTLQWDQPFYTTNGVTTNLEVYVLNDTTGAVVASSTDNAILNQTPEQVVDFANSGARAKFDIVIRKQAGPTPGRIKYVNFANGSDIPDFAFATNSDTINPHGAAASAMAVAAAPYSNQRVLESYSSEGPVNILFDATGNRLATPVVRAKPDITALDGVNTSFFGFDVEGDGFPNFYGTSAAAPDAAGVAALIRAAHPDYTPSQVYALMKSSADPNINGTPGNPNFIGAGLVNAYKALQGSPIPADSTVRDGFESGYLGQQWATYATGPGRVDVLPGNSPQNGTYQLIEDTAYFSLPNTSVFLLNLEEAFLHVNLASMSNATLSFGMKSFANPFESADAMPASFTGHGNYDGVALSVDGTHWFRVQNLSPSSSSSAYQTFTANLSAIAAANGLTLGLDTRIKFQHYDFRTSSSPNSGFGFDNIAVGGTLNLAGAAFYLKLNNDHQHLDIWTNNNGAGAPSQSVLLSLLTGILVTGTGSNQSLTVDFTNGDPLIAAGLSYAGSAAMLSIIGDDTGDTFSVNSAAVNVTGAFGAAPITYTGVTSIAVTGGTGSDTLNQVAQASPITFAGGAGNDILNIQAGTFALNTDVQPTTGNLTVNVSPGASLAIGSPQHLAALNIDAGAATIAPGGNNTLITSALSLINGAKLDLADNSMIVDYTTTSPIDTLRNYLGTGFSNGAWNGVGINSSVASADPASLHALGYAEASDLGIGSSAVVIRYTKYGDNNLDGVVDVGNDFSLILDGLANPAASSWFQGDYTFDGKVDLGNDFSLYLRSVLLA